MQEKSSDTRAHRLGFRVLVKVARVGEHPHLASTRDISETGLLLEAPQSFEVGAQIQLQLFLPGARAQIELLGTVMRSAGRSESGELFGVQFTDPSPEAAAELAKFFAARGARAREPIAFRR